MGPGGTGAVGVLAAARVLPGPYSLSLMMVWEQKAST